MEEICAPKSTVFQCFPFLAHPCSLWLILSLWLWLTQSHPGSFQLTLALSLALSDAHQLTRSLLGSQRRSCIQPHPVYPALWGSQILSKESFARLTLFFCNENEVRGWPYQNFGMWGGVIFLFFFSFLRHGESFFQFRRRTSLGPEHGCLLVFINCFIQSQTNSCYSYLSDATKVFPCPMNDFLAYL